MEKTTKTTTMSSEEVKSRGPPAAAGDRSAPPLPQFQYPYGTFGLPDYSQPAIGFPQPAPPPGFAAGGSSTGPSPYPPPSLPPFSAAGPQYYAHGYQSVTGYAPIAEGRPLRMPRLPCCGIGIGWVLFLAGFFLGFPWYIGAFILLCVRVDYREKPGMIACTIAAVLSAIAIILGVTKGNDLW